MQKEDALRDGYDDEGTLEVSHRFINIINNGPHSENNKDTHTDKLKTYITHCFEQRIYSCVICVNSFEGMNKFVIHIIEYHDHKKKLHSLLYITKKDNIEINLL